MARFARDAGHHAIAALLVLHRVVALRADVAALDRLHAELIGDLLRPRLAMQRIERRKVRRLHPLLHFGLMALRTLVGPNDLRRSLEPRGRLCFFGDCMCGKSDQLRWRVARKIEISRKGAKAQSECAQYVRTIRTNVLVNHHAFA